MATNRQRAVEVEQSHCGKAEQIRETCHTIRLGASGRQGPPTDTEDKQPNTNQMTQTELAAYAAMTRDRDHWKEQAEKLQRQVQPDATTYPGWVGKLTHDRSDCADWGWLRDENGDLIIIVKAPPATHEDEDHHRRAGTDPTQKRVDSVLARINGQNIK